MVVGIAGAVLETHQIARRAAASRIGDEAGLQPADLRDVIGQAHELANGVEGDLRIVGASLHRQIAAGAFGHQLIAAESGHIDQGCRAFCDAGRIGPCRL